MTWMFVKSVTNNKTEMRKKLIQNKKAIAITVAIILAALLATVSLYSLCISIPFILCAVAEFEIFESKLFKCAFGAFATALCVFAFLTNTWFGILMLTVCILTGIIVFVEKAQEPLVSMLLDPCGFSIATFNVGLVCFNELNLFVLIVSIIAIITISFCSLFGFIHMGIVNSLPIKEQIDIYESKEHLTAGEKGILLRLYQDAKQNVKDPTVFFKDEDAVKKRKEFRQKYVNADMERIEQILSDIPQKRDEINSFNNQLQNAINEYEEKAIRIIEETYKNALGRTTLPRASYFKVFDSISQKYSSELNPVLATACETSVKKIANLINKKQEIINNNNADIAKFNLLVQKLQEQYDVELALNKIKEINKDVNSQMEDSSDIINKENEKNDIQGLIDDIDGLEKVINERRNYEIQFGQIEI